jgi:hypothetical protein
LRQRTSFGWPQAARKEALPACIDVLDHGPLAWRASMRMLPPQKKTSETAGMTGVSQPSSSLSSTNASASSPSQPASALERKRSGAAAGALASVHVRQSACSGVRPGRRHGPHSFLGLVSCEQMMTPQYSDALVTRIRANSCCQCATTTGGRVARGEGEHVRVSRAGTCKTGRRHAAYDGARVRAHRPRTGAVERFGACAVM